MKKTLIAAAAVAGLATTAHAQEKNLVTIVTSPDPQTQLMSMVLTMQAVQQGATTRVLLCGPGGDIAFRDAPASATVAQPPRGMSPQGLMTKILEAGAKVEVCAIYLPGKGVGPEALLDGVGVAKPPEMADAMLSDDTIIWSF